MTAPRIALCLCLCLLLGAAAGLPGSAQAEELTIAKAADIRQLLNVSGSGAVGRQLAQITTQQVVQALHKSRPDIPARTLAIVEREVRGLITENMEGPGGMLDRIVPLYANTFSHQEIRELLAFYNTPTGKKAVAALPGLMQQGQQIGQSIAREMAPELKRRLKAALDKEGVVLDKMP